MNAQKFTICSMMLAACAATALSSCNEKATQSADSQLPPIDVAYVQVDSVTLYKSYPGTLKAIRVVDLVARVNGYLRSQNYNGGDIVKQGQVLFTIDNPQYADAVAQARASLESAKSARDYAQSHYLAVEKAYQKDAASKMEAIQAKSNYEQCVANVKNAEATLQTALSNLGYCTIRAPFTGHASTSEPSVGAYLNGEASPTTLATIYEDNKLFAEFNIEDASYLRMLSNCDSISSNPVNYDSIPIAFNEPLPHNYKGKLTYIAPDVNTGTGTILLRAEIENPYNELRDGMYATISMPVKVDPKACLVKDASIATDQLGKYIYTVTDSGIVKYTPIKVGSIVRDSMRVVTEGVGPDTRYVTKALLKVRNDMHVKPILTK